MYNKPQGCGTSVALATGPDDEEPKPKKHFQVKLLSRRDYRQVLLYAKALVIYRVRVNCRRILQNHIFTNTEQKYTTLLPFERGMFAVS